MRARKGWGREPPAGFGGTGAHPRAARQGGIRVLRNRMPKTTKHVPALMRAKVGSGKGGPRAPPNSGVHPNRIVMAPTPTHNWIAPPSPWIHSSKANRACKDRSNRRANGTSQILGGSKYLSFAALILAARSAAFRCASSNIHSNGRPPGLGATRAPPLHKQQLRHRRQFRAPQRGRRFRLFRFRSSRCRGASSSLSS